jgi:hypothetical protein
MSNLRRLARESPLSHTILKLASREAHRSAVADAIQVSFPVCGYRLMLTAAAFAS